MWTANLFQVTTGTVGPRVNFKSLSWSISLNEIESASLDVTKADLPSIDLRYWLAPWWAGVLVMYDNVPIFAGPIISRPTENMSTIRVECKGIRALFDRRYVLDELTNWGNGDLPRMKIRFDAKDYGTVAQLAIKKVMAKPGGNLPIVFPMPEKSAISDDAHTTTVWSGYDLASLTGNSILDQMSNLTNGPDIMFRPRLLDANSLVWDMFHGDETNPHIPQTIYPVWDTTSTKSDVTDLDVVTTGTYQTNRMFVTGAGSNELTLMNAVTDTSSLSKGYPLLEGMKALGSTIQSDAAVLSGAKSALTSNAEPLEEIQLSVRVDGQYKLGSFWPGDSVALIVKGWLSLNDGTHRLRLLNINGSNDGDVRMSLQTEK
jgi:hypothetical protein